MIKINVISLLAIIASTVLAATIPVSIVEYRFIPDTAQVVQGDTIVWTNNGAFPHTSTSGVNGVWDSIWDSGTLTPSQSYARAFVNVGNFPYFCRFHYLTGMRGMVKVSPSGINDAISNTVDFGNGINNSPNPFHSATKITYKLNVPGVVTLKILNVSGQMIKIMKIRETKPGWHSVVWDGKDNKNQIVSSGVYICRLISDNQKNYQETAKIRIAIIIIK